MFSFKNIEEENKPTPKNIDWSVAFCTKWIISSLNTSKSLDYSMGDSGKPNKIITFKNNKGINININLSESKTMLLKETKELGRL